MLYATYTLCHIIFAIENSMDDAICTNIIWIAPLPYIIWRISYKIFDICLKSIVLNPAFLS